MDEKNKQTTHFVELNNDEKTSKLLLVAKKKSNICIWNKGNDEKISFSASIYSKNNKLLSFMGNKQAEILGPKVLFTFEIDGLAFFGEGELVISGDAYGIKAIKRVYKSERRRNFRLLTFPNYEVYLEFYDTDEVKSIEAGNVVSMSTGQSQTGLFKDFLRLMAVNEGESENGGIRLRVQDISVTGLSFLVGDIESKYFTAGEETGQIMIIFEDEEVEIQNAKVVYVMETKGRSKAMKMHKVGMQFTEVDEKTDLLLGKLINQALRDVKEEFEDFIS